MELINGIQLTDLIDGDYPEIDKKKIELKNAIKNEGEFTAKVRLFAGVAADLKVIVTIA